MKSAITLLLCALPALAQPYALAPTPKLQFFHSNGAPMANGKLCTYIAGTTTPVTTYQTMGGTANTNPIILNSRGEANVWLSDTNPIKFDLRMPGGSSSPTA